MSKTMFRVAKEGEGFPMYLEEGNFTRVETFRGDNGICKGGTYASALSDGSLVEIQGTADRTVQLAASGLQIGYLDGEPSYENPAATASTGNYTRARGNVILMGGSIHRVKLVAGNATIVPGYYLATDSTKIGFDREEDTTSNVIALENADSSSGKSILAFVSGRPVNEAD